MLYNKFKDITLSALGMGCMRLPTVDGQYSKVDVPAVKEMVGYAMEHGVNYYDTAWGYHDGASQTAIGEALKEYDRSSFYLANKFPGYDLSNMPKVKEIFEAQLKMCGVEYFDFYLFHNLCEMNIDQYLDPKYGILEYLLKQKAEGRIKHLGVSVHGTLETLKKFLDAYGEHIEFCQLQLNWLDWNFQQAKLKVDLLNERNIPIWVMEPLRGGALVNLNDKYLERLNALHSDWRTTRWAFGFLQSVKGVAVTLSGMSNMAQLTENIAIYESKKDLSDEDISTLLAIASDMTGKKTLPCTACRYCTSKCPMELNIPWLIELYNEHIYSEGGFIAPMAMNSLPESKRPSACIGCRSCEAVCPQSIKISEMMTDFTEKLKG